MLELSLEDGFVESFGAFHVLHVNFEPSNGISVHDLLLSHVREIRIFAG
jgi:hypothetical protein